MTMSGACLDRRSTPASIASEPPTASRELIGDRALGIVLEDGRPWRGAPCLFRSSPPAKGAASRRPLSGVAGTTALSEVPPRRRRGARRERGRRRAPGGRRLPRCAPDRSPFAWRALLAAGNAVEARNHRRRCADAKPSDTAPRRGVDGRRRRHIGRSRCRRRRVTGEDRGFDSPGRCKHGQASTSICLWYDGTAEDKARFYAATFPDRKRGRCSPRPRRLPQRQAGRMSSVVEFTEAGIPCASASTAARPFKHNEAFSFQIATDDQAGDLDRLWNAIVKNGGQEMPLSGLVQGQAGPVLAGRRPAPSARRDCRSR